MASDHDLPGCMECGGNARHLHTCSGYDPVTVISTGAGWPVGWDGNPATLPEGMHVHHDLRGPILVDDNLRTIAPDDYIDDEGITRCCGCGGVVAHGHHDSRCYAEES